MREEAEILDELHTLNSELKSFPPEAHWFCPRRQDDDPIDYENPGEAEEDMSSEMMRESIQLAERRHNVAYKYSLILGLAPAISGQMLQEYTGRLEELLTTCDRCVRNYHMGRKAYLKELAEQFDEDTIVELSNRLNSIDFERMDTGLKAAETLLAGVDPSQRTQSTLIRNNPAGLIALYEALCCVDYHKSEEKLSGPFKYVFGQLQTKKTLRLSDILPAMARFLFDSDEVRLRFAKQAWQKMNGLLTPRLFEWVVHDTLAESIATVSQPSVSYGDIQRFWEGMLLVLARLDEDLIRHSLRAMEIQPDIYHLALQHLSCNSEQIVRLVIEGLRILINKSSKDFWEAFNTISAATVAEQIFTSPVFGSLLSISQESETSEEMPSATSWIPGFIESLPAVHQYDACRSLLYHLFERLQDSRIPATARMACCRAGLKALAATLDTFVQTGYKINPSTSLIVINDVMGLVNTYKATIIACADLEAVDQRHLELKRLGMLVIRDGLALDCKALSAEFYALEQGTEIQRGIRTPSQSIWQDVLDIFRPGNLELAKSILAATTALTGLDELRPADKKKPTMPKDHVQFNKDFHQFTENVSRVFERLSDFDATDLRQLYESPQTARPLFAALVSAKQAIYEAAIEVIKAMTDHSGKMDAISSLLDQAFTPMLNSLSFAVIRITKARTFSPVPYMIKTGREILESLCGSTGILRTRFASSVNDRNAIMTWWTTQWRALDTVFSTTEYWVSRVNKPTKYMEEFCRDGMDYAEALFDAYSIIATAVGESNLPEDSQLSVKSDSSRISQEKVLQVVCYNVYGLTMLLRLRDKYLVSVITSLLRKLLRCLGEFEMEIDENALCYIKDACKRENEKDFKRTNLTNQQKAELQRALDEHQGVEIIEKPAHLTVKKQVTIDAWSKSADGKKFEPSTVVRSQPKIKFEERNKSTLEQMRLRQQVKPTSDFLKSSRQRAAEEKKQRDAAAIAKAKALRGHSSLVPGEGSGLRDIGVQGKDHAPLRSEIMVGSSDEDSDSDSDSDDDETNSLINKRKEKSKLVLEVEESRRRNLKEQRQGPVRKTKVQRDAKDMRARVAPDMTRLYLEMLNWDIFHQGDSPPGNNECLKVAYKFRDLDVYRRTFGPLLISEIWCSLNTAKDESDFKPAEIKVLNRMSVDKFLEVTTNMPIASNRDLKMSERDIVLLSRSQDPLKEPQEPHSLARVDRINRKKDVVEITYKVSRECSPSFLQSLVPNGKMYALKIADMTTTEREFAALSSLEYYDLCNEILEAKPSPIQKYTEEKMSFISSKYQLNRGQAQAVLSANDNDGFTLIQGPPGSGKTKTIVAMVGALLTQTLQTQHEPQNKARPHGQTGASPSPPPKKKLLICAPSNAAVDELVLRLKDGIQPLSGTLQKINVIRIGRSDAINANVKDVMLDELVRIKLEGDKKEKSGVLSQREKLHQEAGQIKERLNVMRPQLDEARSKGDKALELRLQREFDSLKRNQAHIGAKIDEDKESGNTVVRENKINRIRFQQEIIDSAHVLCATLSGSGHDMFRDLSIEFETVIIDEAAQCIELSALIPLKYGCTRCILVGDPEQLPPTVLSRSAQGFGYEQSLFVRMQHNHPNDIHLLDTQYRMHPEISLFPSQQFYNSRLVDGENMAILRQQPWHASSMLGPYRFFDVEGIQTKEAQGHSFINVQELNTAMLLYDRLKKDYGSIDFKGKIGIITGYKAQLNELRARFLRRYGETIFDEIEFNTTDAFQGREREIIIFSCVRAKATGGIGFLGDIRRMNVGLTRAKSSLWVLGDSRSLQQGEFWSKLIQDSKRRDRYTGGDVMALLSRPTTRHQLTLREALPSESAEYNGKQLSVQTTSLNRASALELNNQSRVTQLDLEPRTQAILSERVSTLDFDYLARPLQMDSDIEMVDAPSISNSRKSSLASNSTVSVDMKTNGKRPRESSAEQGEVPVKRMHPLSNDKLPVASVAATTEAAPTEAPGAKEPPRPKVAPVRSGALGVLPPRKKPPADPFIRRKPPGRRRSPF